MIILIRWEYLTTRADYSINVRPHPMMLGKALADYVAKVDDAGFVWPCSWSCWSRLSSYRQIIARLVGRVWSFYMSTTKVWSGSKSCWDCHRLFSLSSLTGSSIISARVLSAMISAVTRSSARQFLSLNFEFGMKATNRSWTFDIL